MSIKKIIIKGSKEAIAPLNANDDLFELKETYLVGTASRGIAGSHEVILKDSEVVELVFEDDTTWICNADTLEDIFPEAVVMKRSASEAFVIPTGITNDHEERGIVGDVLLKAMNIFTKKKLSIEIKELAGDLERKQLDNRSGLYQVDKSFHLQKFTGTQSDKPWIVFLHGTNSSTKGSFGELLETDVWNYLHQAYEDHVLALEHETLTKSPLQNVLHLLEELPQLASVHLISHSRGGLVGDVLARFCSSNESSRGFDINEINYLKKENRKTDLDDIDAINQLLAHKKVTVNKFIRVACPASGTTLASGRMDNFFNMTFNLVGLATGQFANPIYVSFKSLLSSLINCKNDVDTLPGLEAMNPESPFVKVLNSPATTVALDNPLAIISGNCKTKINLKALLIIASKLFFTKNNDLVVNTAAMYRGAVRQSSVQYFFDEATDVDHFHYFKNSTTQAAILNALKTVADAPIPGFQLLQTGAVGLDRNALLKLDGGQVFSDTVTGTRPIIVLLPGIMGSNLSADDKLVWINYLRFLSGGLKKLDIKSPGIIAPSLIKTSYAKIVNHLEQSYDVVTFAFDWRQQLNQSAQLFKNKIEELLGYKQPIKIIGHSMGGVLVRDFMVTQRPTWEKLNNSPGFKLIFLGAPLGGSYRIPYVLFGNDAIIDKISKLDIFHSKKELLSIFSKFPGLLSLLPHSTEKDNDFGASETWKLMLDAHGDAGWPLPGDPDIKTFGTYRNKILSSITDTDFANAVYIAGKDKSTPCAYRVDSTAQGKQLTFLSTAEGDQSVTWESGIPKKMIENNQVYYVNVSHGALANEPSLFRGIEDILSTGSTAQFSKIRPVVRGTEKLFKTPVIDDHDISPEAVEKVLLGLTTSESAVAPETRLEITVCNGDLRYATYPLLVGHFLNDGITSAEAQIDKQLNYALSNRYQLSIYPGDIGSSEVFISMNEDFKGAVIVGLGAQSAFTAFQLTQTIEQGICRYLLDIDKNISCAAGIDGAIGISALIVGSGYGGLSIENSVRAIIQAVQNANEKIRKLHDETGPVIQRLEFVELYEDAALGCFYSLRKIEKEEDRMLNIRINKKIVKMMGARKRIQARGSEAWWNRIVVKQKENAEYNKERTCFVFSASTGAARDLERELYLSPSLIKEMLDEISTNNSWSVELAKTIFELLVPNDFKEQLKRRSNASWVLDNYTASYPWELLQDSVTEVKPLCINAGMIRQLSVKDTPFRINTVTANNVLVVGDPFLDGFVNQLPGAYREAEMVVKKLESNNLKIVSSLKESSAGIIKKLFYKDYKIIHLAGHGVFNEAEPARSGMVIGKGVFLTTAEIAQMSSVPEFVFVNCCFLGKTDAAAEAFYRNRYQLAAGIGVQLIRNGVRAVIVAGWAVDDDSALDFADTFYTAMLGGDNFGDAVKMARKHCYEKNNSNNTWGAYQCYGDPFYKFDMRQSGSARSWEYVIAEEAEIDLDNLYNNMAMGAPADEEILNKLKEITGEVDKAGIRNAAITEKEAFIYAQLLQYDQALAKFNELMQMEKATFYVSTLETFCNTKANKTVQEFKNGTVKTGTALLQMNKNIDELRNLLYISPTAERYTLLGSTHTRRAFVSTAFAQKKKALADAALNYQQAFRISGEEGSIAPMINWYLSEGIMVLLGERKWEQKVEVGEITYELPVLKESLALLSEKKKQLVNNSSTCHSYDERMASVNLMVCQSILQPQKATQKDFDDLLMSYRKTWATVGSRAKKIAGIEQLEMIIDALSSSEQRPVIKYCRMLTGVKESLEKTLGN
jgi:hypothetical protein